VDFQKQLKTLPGRIKSKYYLPYCPENLSLKNEDNVLMLNFSA